MSSHAHSIRLFSICGPMFAASFATNGQDAKSALTVSLSDGPALLNVLCPARGPLIVTFRNTGNEPARLLNEFGSMPIQTFLTVHIVRKDGTAIAIPGAGKADFPNRPLRYQELQSGKAFSTSMPIDQLVPRDLETGQYDVSVVYHNQYGENCFKGEVVSKTVTITIPYSAGVLTNISARVPELVLTSMRQYENSVTAFYGSTLEIRIDSFDSIQAADQGVQRSLMTTWVVPTGKETFKELTLYKWDSSSPRVFCRIALYVVNVEARTSPVVTKTLENLIQDLEQKGN